MNRTHWGPRTGSRAYLALQFLLQFGPLDTADWMIHAAVSKSASKFEREVIGPLTRWKLAAAIGGVFSITPAGRGFLGGRGEERTEQVVTPGRYVPSKLPLSAKHRPALGVIRPGALDYRGIPSLHAGKQVAFRSSITVQHEDSNG